LLQAPVGSGKTALAKAMSVSDGGTTAVVKTKSLQQQYAEGYDFDVVFGRANYPCVHPERETLDSTAADCIYESMMNECEYAEECPYLIAKHIAQASSQRVINYAYMNTSRWVKLPQYATDYLFLDECHNLPDETLEFVSCTVREGERIKWRLPEFPSVYDSSRNSIGLCLRWMEQSIGILKMKVDELKKETDPYSKSQRSKAERLVAKLAQTCSAVHLSGEDWYSRAGLRALSYDGKSVPGMVAKPLTARWHFKKLFIGAYPKTILMSATIGNPNDFAEELGLGNNWEFHAVPNQWPPQSRPVHVLDVPSQGAKATESARQKQADAIAKIINECPSDWSGVVHLTSWKGCWDLRGRLVKAGLNAKRLFIPQRGGTNKQMDEWNHVRENGRGMLILSPSMHSGVDLLRERVNICAKVPFGFFMPSTYEWERMQYSNRFYRWQTASTLEQQMGRTRRGREEDYDTDFERRGLCVIADGSFQKMGMQKSCSEGFNEVLIFD